MHVHVMPRDSDMYGCENARFQERKRALFQIAPVCAFLRSVCGFFALDLRLVCPRKLDCSSESSTFMRSQTSSENTCRRGPKINFRDKAVRQYVPKMHFRRDRGFENLLEKAVFGETKLIRNHVRKAIFGETGGPKIWSEKPFSKKPGWSENLSEK